MTKNISSKSVGEIKIKNKIYTIRGAQVMLDSDLAEIYGYTTKAFNQQVMRNLEKFEGEEFMFRLKEDEMEYLSRSQNVTSMQTIGVKGGRVYLPYAFTEQGIYMLMTVLKGELAIKQSRALVIAFKAMKDYILDNNYIASRTIENTKDILELKSDIKNVKGELRALLHNSNVEVFWSAS